MAKGPRTSFAHRVDAGPEVRLSRIDTRADGGLDREEAEEMLFGYLRDLEELQQLLYAAGRTSVLIVLQGMDSAGKDGVIRHVLGRVNPQGCEVTSFKVPTEEELAHDFLWRIHARTPQRGRIGVFNRSHYEDVLIARVKGLVPETVWRARYDQINHFESLLAQSGTLILKFFLHISRKEQKDRLLAREQDPIKAWKLSVSDWQERRFWGAYQKAYEDAINRCRTLHAPWYIVPADRKWFRNLAVAQAVVEAILPFRTRWMNHLRKLGKEEKARLEAFRKKGK